MFVFGGWRRRRNALIGDSYIIPELPANFDASTKKLAVFNFQTSQLMASGDTLSLSTHDRKFPVVVQCSEKLDQSIEVTSNLRGMG